MTTLADKVAFARKHWRAAPDGDPFEIDENGWLYKHYWRPLHSYRLWPVERGRLCDECRARAGSLVEDYYAADDTRTKEHAKAHDCAGLTAEIIQFVLLHLKRQSGKTVGTSGYVAAELFKGWRQRITFISGSEDQSRALFKEHYRDHIKKNPALAKRCTVVGNEISVPSTESHFAFVPTSLSGVTAGSRTKVIIDEARNVPSDLAVALVYQILAQSGWTCTHHEPGNDHTHTKGDLDEPKLKTCQVCGARLVPWAAQVLITSSAGELKGGVRDWFFELLDANEEDPHPRAYVYSEEETVNEKVAASMENAIASFLGRAESLRAAVDTEGHNLPRKRGEDVITQAEIKRCSDRTLGVIEVGGCSEPAYGFCDCATVVEKVSIAAIADDTQHKEYGDPWSYVYIPHLRFWIPADCLHGVIDDKEVEAEVELTVKRFPGMRKFYVDTRGLPWAVKMTKRLQAKSPHFRKIVQPWGLRGAESETGWMELEIRYRQRTIRHPYDPAILKEAKGLHRRKKGDRLVVDDVNRKKSHKDILENFAMLCYLALRDSSRTRQRYVYKGIKGEKKESRMRNPLSGARHGKHNFGPDGM